MNLLANSWNRLSFGMDYPARDHISLHDPSTSYRIERPECSKSNQSVPQAQAETLGQGACGIFGLNRKGLRGPGSHDAVVP